MRRGKCDHCSEYAELNSFEGERLCEYCIEALEEKRQIDTYWQEEASKYQED